MKAFLRKIFRLCFGGPKRRCVAIGLVAVALLVYVYSWATYLFVIPIRPTLKPFATAYHDGMTPYILGDTFNYLFDTGWNISTVYEDTVTDGFVPFKILKAKDANHQSKLQFYYFKPEYQRGLLEQSPMIAYFFPKDQVYGLPYFAKKENPYMAIGGTTIRGANWLLNTLKDSLYCLPFGQLPEGLDLEKASFALSYHGRWYNQLSMLTDIEIDGVLVKDVLIDTGSSETLNIGMRMAEALGIREFAKETKGRKATAYGIVEKTEKIVPMDSILLNDVLFRNLAMNWNEENKLAKDKRLGYGFFKRFHKIFIDSERRKIYFFNDLVNMKYEYSALWNRYFKFNWDARKLVRERIRELREARGISLRQIREDTEISYVLIEDGSKPFFDFSVVEKFCDYLGLTLAEFFEGVEKSPDIR